MKPSTTRIRPSVHLINSNPSLIKVALANFFIKSYGGEIIYTLSNQLFPTFQVAVDDFKHFFLG